MGFSKILFCGGLALSFTAVGNLSAGTVPHGSMGCGASAKPNHKAFERALPKHRQSHGMCARAVRVALEELTGKKLDRRDYAKEYGEPLLKTGYYVKASANAQPRNYDVRILLPRKRHHCGHIEVFYRGNWYSDFRQPGSLWNVWPKEYSRIQFYRFVGQSYPAVGSRGNGARKATLGNPNGSSRATTIRVRSAAPARTTPLF
ncbi:hypothetical protein MAMC_01587 [Methylacidimicrobium cyclopophantes]|uniref:Uncharacterized protein n=1 Tax=Methylacidimicrobium cyclopophantes TaxID=1041766 RepID=A0A5E6MHQ6_9BACT|nr:hypothetical protein [Methylacidimicrobium cyclopophantes]VVM07428.1 hypothetical protein MAMC_01587 [Methylacidimicrobium cyclopophantes]